MKNHVGTLHSVFGPRPFKKYLPVNPSLFLHTAHLIFFTFPPLCLIEPWSDLTEIWLDLPVVESVAPSALSWLDWDMFRPGF